MSSKKELESPLLFGSQSDYTGGGGVGAPIEPTIAHAHSHETAAVNVEDVKFGEYVSRAKARATNKLKIFGCIPFHVVMLICIMFLSFGGYWCYDIPGSIETQLTAWFGGSYGHSSNSLFYSIYSWPNCILAFFGGVILDKFTGVRKGALLFCGLVALGQLIFSLGCQWKVYYLALFGRFVFGLGSESLGVAQNTFTVRWFDGKGLALAFGLVVAFSRIGTSVNFVVSPILASSPIAFEQNFYVDKDCSNVSPIFQPIEGDMNECVAGRYLDCESEEPDDDTPTSLVFYSTVDGLCDAANQTTSIQFQADKCFHTPAPWNATHLSARIQLVPESTEYLIQLYTDAECTSKETSLATGSDVTPFDLFTVSEGPLKVYGQGNGCFNGTVGGANFRVTQPIETLCYVATYSDMLCNGRELNRYGMKRDTCYVPLDPSRPPYQFAIHPGNGVPLTLWIGMLMCGVSMTACILASTTDFWGEKKVEADRQKYMATLSPEEAAYVRKLDDMNEPASDDISFKMIKKIPISAWILFLIIGVFYVAILNFYQVASDILQHTGDHIDDNTAGLYMAIPNFVAIIGSPLGGFTVDRVGRALVLICVACTMLICSHVFFLALAYGWITFTPVPVMLWLGCTYSLGASCLIPILAFIVDKDTLGTAYGCMTSVQNLFLAVAALAIGQLQDWAKSSHPGVLQYTLPIMIFIGCASIGLLLTILLIFVDARNGGKLNASAAERAERLKREEIEQEARNQATATGSVPLAVEANTSSEDDFVNSSPSNSVNGSKHY